MRKSRTMAKLNCVILWLAFIFVAKQTIAQAYPLRKQKNKTFTSTERPWIWWFWLGNIESENEIKLQLQSFSQSGFGGVTIISTYGVKGFEKSEILFRSPRWYELIAFTIKEAKNLDMQVDLAESSAWPYGGPSVSVQAAAKMLKGYESFYSKGGTVSLKLLTNRDNQSVAAVSAFSGKQRYLDLGSSVNENAVLETNLPGGDWKIDVLYSENTMQMVKRSSPGGEGLVLDPFSIEATQSYMQGFDSAYQYMPGLRSAFNDSYEIYGADFTPRLFVEFEKRRGYSLKPLFSLLFDSTASELKERIRCDYRETISDLLLDGFVSKWTQWNHQHGFLVTEQAHGSPGNLLDLYGSADIPQTESFGPSHFSIPGVRTDPDIKRDRYKWPDKLMFKFASSSAHTTGRNLCSAETATWLTNHYRMALSQVKPQVDELFVAGINHVMLISATNTPSGVPFPGWVFYPAPDFGSYAPFYKYLPDFSSYISRVQHYLQNSKPDNDILVYFPVYDYYSEAPNDLGILATFDHVPTKWGDKFSFGNTVRSLWNYGYSFDYISDQQILQLKTDGDNIIAQGGGRYKVIVIPSCNRMPLETMNALVGIAEQGVRIVFENAMPSDVPGGNKITERKTVLNNQLNELKTFRNVEVSNDLNAALFHNGCIRENFNSLGLQFIRKKFGNGKLYFIANLDSIFSRGFLTLGTINNSYRLMDPLTGKLFLPRIIKKGKKKFVDLELLPGQSCFLFTDMENASVPGTYTYTDFKNSFSLKADWKIEFEKNGFMSPTPVHTSELKSWTDFDDSAARYFCGTADYSARFDLPASINLKTAVRMQIPGLRDMAELYINDKLVGRSWCVPYTFDISSDLLIRKGNSIRIRVTNLSTNRLIWMDKHKVQWKDFYIADPVEKVFNASDWDLQPSGIIGDILLHTINNRDNLN